MQSKLRCSCLLCPPKLFQYCEQLYLYLPLLLRAKRHFLHDYFLLMKHMCMPQETTVPGAFILRVVILRFPHFSWPDTETYYFIQDLIFPTWLRVKDAESVCVKVPDSISLLSVCTSAMRERGPGTVSAQSHSNLDVLLWGLSLPLPSGFRASHTHSFTDYTHTHTWHRQKTYSVLAAVNVLLVLG